MQSQKPKSCSHKNLQLSIYADYRGKTKDTEKKDKAIIVGKSLKIPSQEGLAFGLSGSYFLDGWQKIYYLKIALKSADITYQIRIKNPKLHSTCHFDFLLEDLSFQLSNQWRNVPSVTMSDLKAIYCEIKGLRNETDRPAQLFLSNLKLIEKPLDDNDITPPEATITQLALKALGSEINRFHSQAYLNKVEDFLNGGKVPVSGILSCQWDHTKLQPSSKELTTTHGRFAWHCLHTVAMLCAYSEKKNSAGAFFLARQIYEKWSQEHELNSSNDIQYAWYDHGTALRSITLIYLWQLANIYKSDRYFMNALEKSIYRHGRLLASEVFYAYNQPMRHHNHAIYQDMALLLIGTVCQKATWINQAVERLHEQAMELFVYEKGFAVLTENSMSYHVGMIQLFSNIAALAEVSGVSHRFTQIKKDLQAFANMWTYQDKRTPSFGDSPRTANPKINLLAQSQKDIQSNSTEFHVLEKAGYGILKGQYNQRPFTLCFIAPSQNITHKHADHLSFTLFFDGIEWFIDPSYHSYEHQSVDPFASYLRGPSAHNCLTVEGLDSEYQLNPGLAHITGSIQSDHYLFEGHHSAYEHLTILRQIKIVKEEFAIELKDEVSHTAQIDPAQACLRFHLGEDVFAHRLTNYQLKLTHPASNYELILNLENDYHLIEISCGEDIIKGGISGLGHMQHSSIVTIESRLKRLFTTSSIIAQKKQSM